MAEQYLTIDHLTTEQITRLFSKIIVNPITRCWEWQGARNLGGYANTTYRQRLITAHRVMFAWLVSPLPAHPIARGLPVLDHLCRVRHCVNPAHLELVSIGTNVLRGQTIPAHHAEKEVCPQGHLYTAENTYVGPTDGARQCRTCRRDAQRKRNAADPEKRRAYKRERAKLKRATDPEWAERQRAYFREYYRLQQNKDAPASD